MNNAEITRTIWNRIHSIAVTIDPIKLIGDAVVENKNRPLSKSEQQNAVNIYRKICKGINKKSKIQGE